MKINSNIKIIGEKIILIPYKKSHVQKYHSWMQNEELLELTASEPLTLEQEYEMQQSWFEDEDKCTFIVVDKETLEKTGNELDSIIGDVNLYLNDPEDPKASEIEVMIAGMRSAKKKKLKTKNRSQLYTEDVLNPAHRSKGKGKEALLFMLRYGMETLSINTFIAKIKMKNSQSLKLFTTIGFTETTKSEVFQEIEMRRLVDERWKTTLIEKTQSYKIDFY